jgi:hypothetical protein
VCSPAQHAQPPFWWWRRGRGGEWLCVCVSANKKFPLHCVSSVVVVCAEKLISRLSELISPNSYGHSSSTHILNSAHLPKTYSQDDLKLRPPSAELILTVDQGTEFSREGYTAGLRAGPRLRARPTGGHSTYKTHLDRITPTHLDRVTLTELAPSALVYEIIA